MEGSELESLVETEQDIIYSFQNFPKLTKRSYHTPTKIPRKSYIPTLQYLSVEREDYYYKELSDAIHVSENVLRKWHDELQKNPFFHPIDAKYTNKRNRKLSDQLEDVMIRFIEKYYLNPVQKACTEKKTDLIL